ncbi:hypothetical protein TWF730_010593 [Orbilia blumenaviensis]|uniref:DNA helicase n=1 Tax=Orbilia blumenaviensis TaxID=1796055 RepID=A0AAV9UT50_9PEZI
MSRGVPFLKRTLRGIKFKFHPNQAPRIRFLPKPRSNINCGDHFDIDTPVRKLGLASQVRFLSSSSKAPKPKDGHGRDDDDNESKGPDAGTSELCRIRKPLPQLSEQQEQAKQILTEGKQNILINACAGSGKTTTVLQMARIGKRLLALLYNERLKAETIARAKELELDNLTIDNYHGLAYHHYSKEAATDQGLKRIVEENMSPIRPLPEFDVLILDEQQDMNPIIYNFVLKLLRDCAKTGTKSPQLMLLGDPRQEIYQFNNADKRFLTHCRELFPGQYIANGKVHERTWVEINQTVSFRMTRQIIRFINHQLLKDSGPHIEVAKDKPSGPLPRYVVCDAFGDVPLREVKRLLYEGRIPPEDILIMAPSLRSMKGFILELANRIALEMPEVKIHVPSDDNKEVSKTVSAGKIVFASYHQAKGIEREAAILFNFSSSYYDFYDRYPTTLTHVGNVQYVAATRARKHLVLIHHHKDDYLPFIDQDTLSEYCYLPPGPDSEVKPCRTKKEIQQMEDPKHQWRVTDLTRNIPETVLSECFKELGLEMVRKPNKQRVWPPTEIEVAPGEWEAVADITGTAVPAIYEYFSKDQEKCALITEMVGKLKELPSPLCLLLEQHDKYKDHMLAIENRLKEKKLEISDILFMANISNMLMTGYIHKVLSIPLDKYTWFTIEHFNAAFPILKTRISDSARYEINVCHKFADVKAGTKNVTVRGRTDVFDFARLWELKWTGALRPEHVLQVALYAAVNKRSRIKKFHEKEYFDSQPIEYQEKYAKRKTKPMIPMDIDYNDLKNEVLAKKVKGLSNYLLHIPTGQIVKISSPLNRKKDGVIEVLKMLVKAKSDPPPLAISDQAFLEEAKRGFPSSVGPCTVPPWLSPGWNKMKQSASKKKK